VEEPLALPIDSCWSSSSRSVLLILIKSLLLEVEFEFKPIFFGVSFLSDPNPDVFVYPCRVFEFSAILDFNCRKAGNDVATIAIVGSKIEGTQNVVP
jgi:hypothetical protein